MANGRKQHFLEVYLPNLSSQRLKIPSNFIKHLSGRISGLVSLMGPSGNSWHVQLVEVTGNLYLDDGWDVFVRDHSIEYGDALVFGYDGNMSFTVQIFDQTSCEKEEAFYANCNQGLSDVSENLANKRSEGEADFSSVFGDKRMRVGWIPTHARLEFGTDFRVETSGGEGQEREESLRNSCDKCPIILALPASEEDSQMLLPSMNEGMKKNDVSSETSCKTRTVLKRKKNDVSSEASYETRPMPRRKKNDVSSEPSYKTRRMLGREKNDDSSETSFKTRIMPKRKKNVPVLKTAHSKKEVRTRIKRCIYHKIEANAVQRFTSTFPYFAKYMNSYSAKGGVTIVPVWFSEEHFPPWRMVFTLRNVDGQSWLVNVVPSMHKYSTRHIFSGGWSNFVRDNQIKEKDICVFELVAKDEMRFHISRQGLKGMGSLTKECGFDNRGADNDSAGLDGLPLKKKNVISEGNDAHPSRKSVDINELSMDGIKEHVKVSELTRPPRRKIASSSDTRGNAEDRKSYQTRRKMIDPLSFTSSFPHFMKVLASSNVGGSSTLEIPMEFSSKYLPTNRRRIVLRNMNGDRWHVFSCPYRRRTSFIGGWSSFVSHNNLKVGDICYFELVKKWILQVQVFKSRQMVDYPNSSDDDNSSEDDPDYDLADDRK